MSDYRLRLLEQAMEDALARLGADPDDSRARGELLACIVRYMAIVRPWLLDEEARPAARRADVGDGRPPV